MKVIEGDSSFRKDSIFHKKVVSTKRFLNALSIVSILGFLGIFLQTIFEYDINNYVGAAWMLILGIGLIMEVNFRSLKRIFKGGLNKGNFANLITLIIGLVAVFAAVFSIPGMRIENPSFLAIKGILALIAIVIILIQTFFLDR